MGFLIFFAGDFCILPLRNNTTVLTSIKTLENISTEKIAEVFNLSFSDYAVPVFLTKEQLEDKCRSESVKPEFSAGAFEDNALIAFILHGFDKIDNRKIAYNAGTGVIPSKRGNKLTIKLYEYVLPFLQKNSIDKLLLEVITTNEPAIKTYKKLGFTITKEFNCYKGLINISKAGTAFQIRQLGYYDWKLFCSFWDVTPSWQNSITAVENWGSSNICIGIFDIEKLVGYTIYNTKLKRIHQLAVKKNYRKKGIGSQLLQFIATNYGAEITVINIDITSTETCRFLTNAGLNFFISQYEMELNLESRSISN
jgi:ribosomal protein S18 acetylase RimI-like enzyme